MSHSQPPGRAPLWRPPFCINPDCKNTEPSGDRWAWRYGSFHTAHSGPVPRYRCKACGKILSRSTFDVKFRCKRRLDLKGIALGICAGEGLRTLGRAMKLRPETLTNRISRMGRQALGIMALARDATVFSEDLAADGLVSFTHSQYFPTQYQVLAGSRSYYWHGVDYAVTRRGGTMTPGQKARAQALYARCPMPQASVDESFQRIYGLALGLVAKETVPRVIDTDEHRQYPRAMAKVKARLLKQGEVVGLQHRTTSSKAPRTKSNPLAAVNYLDREIRKDCANHTRETVQWSKESNHAMLRMQLYLCWHNFMKPWRIKDRKDLRCHGEVAGVSREFCQEVSSKLFGQRIFHSRVRGILSESEELTWMHRWPNPHSGRVPQLWPYVQA